MIAFFAICALVSTPVLGGGDRPFVGDIDGIDENSVLAIPANTHFPIKRRVSIGTGKSFLVEFPVELKDVLVSDPSKVDAVVQSSNRVFLIAKGPGQTNAFFFDQRGEQILTIEIMVGADLTGLEALLARLLPGSSIKTELAGKGLVLTGNVRTPLDATRATDIAEQFAEANGELIDPNASSGSATATAEASATTNASAAGASENGRSGGGGAKPKVINLLNVDGEEQVMLRVTVAEVQRSLLKQLGVNLGAVISSGSFVTSLLSENALPLTAAAGLGTLPVPAVQTSGDNAGALTVYNAGPEGGGDPFGNSGAAGGGAFGASRLSYALRALERDGLVRTLAEPNLTAISGESAKFLAGGEYPIPVVDNQGQLSVTYKEYGVGLSFTPIVLSEGRISLKIDTEVSELTNTGAVTLSEISIPALKKRQARSTVELPSGGSLAMAGLLSEDTRQNIDGFPGLKDIPILGTLFRSRDFIRQETELVVIVTPYVVKPVARQALARPLDGLIDPTDLRANFMGHINRIYGRDPELPSGGLKGDYGFIVE